MSFLKHSQYDIFLSYASPNDTPVARGEYHKKKDWQWVQLFRRILEDKLASCLGCRPRIFFDQDEESGIRAGDGLHPKITSALDSSFLFLPLFSNAYLRSVKWCPLEASHFIGSLGDAPASANRVYITHLEKLPEQEWQTVFFPDVCTFSMYSVEPGTSKVRRRGENDIGEVGFLEAVTDLAKVIADRLILEKAREESAAVVKQVTRGKVVLAAVPGELEPLRRDVAAALTAKGWEIVPKQNRRHFDPAVCARETADDAAEALAFVQILGTEIWPGSYDQAQWQAAAGAFHARSKESGIICWLPRSPGMGTVQDAGRRAWLEQIPLWNYELTEFKANLLAALDNLEWELRATKGGRAEFNEPVVFISTMAEDRFDLGCDLVARLSDHSIQADTLGPEDPADVLAQHGLLIAYGSRERAKECARIVEVVRGWRRRLVGPQPPKGLPPAALFFVSPPDGKKAPCAFKGLHSILEDDEEAFEAFIQKVKDFAR